MPLLVAFLLALLGKVPEEVCVPGAGQRLAQEADVRWSSSAWLCVAAQAQSLGQITCSVTSALCSEHATEGKLSIFLSLLLSKIKIITGLTT